MRQLLQKVKRRWEYARLLVELEEQSKQLVGLRKVFPEDEVLRLADIALNLRIISIKCYLHGDYNGMTAHHAQAQAVEVQMERESKLAEQLAQYMNN